MSSRTPEEREAARLERERKRAGKGGETGESAPAPPVAPEPPGTAAPEVLGEPTVEHTPDWASEPTAAPQPEPDFGEPAVPAAEPAGERPLGVKRLGSPSGARAVPKPPSQRRGPIGAYQRLKAKPRGLPKQSRGLKRKGPIVLLILFAVLIWFAFALFQPFKGDGDGTVRVTIPTGSTNGDIGDLLADNDVIGSKFFFGLRVRLAGAKLQSGTFQLKHDMSYGSAIDALTGDAKPATMRVVVPEGKSRSEAAPIVRAAGVTGDYRAASRKSEVLSPRSYGAPKGATLEGFLFPASYEVEPGASARTFVDEQLRAFKSNLATVSLSKARRRNLSAFDVLTIASMVEREAAVASERPKIAAVIYNRLKAGMQLGIDATTRFAVDNWDSPLKQSELASTSPYNTRNRTGLPPGPIGSPGLSSIKAAANPSSDPYLYYVVKPCGKGTHNFSTTDAAHERDVAAYERARQANGGNDPSNATNC